MKYISIKYQYPRLFLPSLWALYANYLLLVSFTGDSSTTQHLRMPTAYGLLDGNTRLIIEKLLEEIQSIHIWAPNIHMDKAKFAKISKIKDNLNILR